MEQAHAYVSKLQPEQGNVLAGPANAPSGYAPVTDQRHPDPSGHTSGAAVEPGGAAPQARDDSAATATVLADVEAKLSALQRRLDSLKILRRQ